MQQMQNSLVVFLFHHFSVVGQCSYVFIPALFLYFYRSILHEVNFMELFTSIFCCFFSPWQQNHCSIPTHASSLSLSRSTVVCQRTCVYNFQCSWKDITECRSRSMIVLLKQGLVMFKMASCTQSKKSNMKTSILFFFLFLSLFHLSFFSCTTPKTVWRIQTFCTPNNCSTIRDFPFLGQSCI